MKPPSIWGARTAGAQLLALVASVVALFVSWRRIYAYATDATGSRMTLFQGEYSLFLFTECTPRTVSGSTGVFTSCLESFSTSYSLPAGYTADFFNKHNVVIAFTVLTVLANLVAVWRAAEAWGAAGGDGASAAAPPSRPSFRTASASAPTAAAAATALVPLAFSAASAVTSLIAWAVFASVVMSDQAYYGSQATSYPGGAEVIYGPGFALMLLAWVASLGGVAAALRSAPPLLQQQRAEGEGEEEEALAAGGGRRDVEVAGGGRR